jgi:hypothetical protein
VALSALVGGERLSSEIYRQLLFLGIPAAVGLLSLVLLRAVPAGDVPKAPPGRLVLGAVIAFAVAQSALPLAYRQGWLILSYGNQKLSSAPGLAVAWGLPVALVLGICGWEWGLRRRLFGAWRVSFGLFPAWAVTLLCGGALSLPALIPGFDVIDRDFVLAGLAVVLCREVALTLLYLRGGLVFAGLGRGVLVLVEAIGINDIVSPYFPAANYVVGDPRFYGLRALTAVLAVSVVALACRRPPPTRRPA